LQTTVVITLLYVLTSRSSVYCLSGTCDRSVVFSTNKTDRHYIAEIFLKATLNIITL